MGHNVPSDRRFYAVGSLQFNFQAPLFKFQVQLGGWVGGGRQYLLPLLLRVLEEKSVVHVAHEQYPYHGGQPGEAPRPLERPLNQCQQQVRDECHPYLDFDGIGTLPIEVAQWEILFYLPKEGLDLPALFVDGDDVFCVHREVVGQQGNHFPLHDFLAALSLRLLHVRIGDCA